MQLYQCDRCGKIIDEKVNKKVFRIYLHINNEVVANFAKDICEECAQQIKDQFLNK